MQASPHPSQWRNRRTLVPYLAEEWWDCDELQDGLKTFSRLALFDWKSHYELMNRMMSLHVRTKPWPGYMLRTYDHHNDESYDVITCSDKAMTWLYVAYIRSSQWWIVWCHYMFGQSHDLAICCVHTIITMMNRMMSLHVRTKPWPGYMLRTYDHHNDESYDVITCSDKAMIWLYVAYIRSSQWWIVWCHYMFGQSHDLAICCVHTIITMMNRMMSLHVRTKPWSGYMLRTYDHHNDESYDVITCSDKAMIWLYVAYIRSSQWWIVWCHYMFGQSHDLAICCVHTIITMMNRMMSLHVRTKPWPGYMLRTYDHHNDESYDVITCSDKAMIWLYVAYIRSSQWWIVWCHYMFGQSHDLAICCVHTIITMMNRMMSLHVRTKPWPGYMLRTYDHHNDESYDVITCSDKAMIWLYVAYIRSSQWWIVWCHYMFGQSHDLAICCVHTIITMMNRMMSLHVRTKPWSGYMLRTYDHHNDESYDVITCSDKAMTWLYVAYIRSSQWWIVWCHYMFGQSHDLAICCVHTIITMMNRMMSLHVRTKPWSGYMLRTYDHHNDESYDVITCSDKAMTWLYVAYIRSSQWWIVWCHYMFGQSHDLAICCVHTIITMMNRMMSLHVRTKPWSGYMLRTYDHHNDESYDVITCSDKAMIWLYVAYIRSSQWWIVWCHYMFGQSHDLAICCVHTIITMMNRMMSLHVRTKPWSGYMLRTYDHHNDESYDVITCSDKAMTWLYVAYIRSSQWWIVWCHYMFGQSHDLAICCVHTIITMMNRMMSLHVRTKPWPGYMLRTYDHHNDESYDVITCSDKAMTWLYVAYIRSSQWWIVWCHYMFGQSHDLAICCVHTIITMMNRMMSLHVRTKPWSGYMLRTYDHHNDESYDVITCSDKAMTWLYVAYIRSSQWWIVWCHYMFGQSHDLAICCVHTIITMMNRMMSLHVRTKPWSGYMLRTYDHHNDESYDVITCSDKAKTWLYVAYIRSSQWWIVWCHYMFGQSQDLAICCVHTIITMMNRMMSLHVRTKPWPGYMLRTYDHHNDESYDVITCSDKAMTWLYVAYIRSSQWWIVWCHYMFGQSHDLAICCVHTIITMMNRMMSLHVRTKPWPGYMLRTYDHHNDESYDVITCSDKAKIWLYVAYIRSSQWWIVWCHYMFGQSQDLAICCVHTIITMMNRMMSLHVRTKPRSGYMLRTYDHHNDESYDVITCSDKAKIWLYVAYIRSSQWWIVWCHYMFGQSHDLAICCVHTIITMMNRMMSLHVRTKPWSGYMLRTYDHHNDESHDVITCSDKAMIWLYVAYIRSSQWWIVWCHYMFGQRHDLAICCVHTIITMMNRMMSLHVRTKPWPGYMLRTYDHHNDESYDVITCSDKAMTWLYVAYIRSSQWWIVWCHYMFGQSHDLAICCVHTIITMMNRMMSLHVRTKPWPGYMLRTYDHHNDESYDVITCSDKAMTWLYVAYIRSSQWWIVWCHYMFGQSIHDLAICCVHTIITMMNRMMSLHVRTKTWSGYMLRTYDHHNDARTTINNMYKKAFIVTTMRGVFISSMTLLGVHIIISRPRERPKRDLTSTCIIVFYWPQGNSQPTQLHPQSHPVSHLTNSQSPYP